MLSLNKWIDRATTNRAGRLKAHFWILCWNKMNENDDGCESIGSKQKTVTMSFPPHSCELSDLLWWRCDRLISCQRRLQVNNIGLFLCQLLVLLCQHGVHFLASLPLWLNLLPLEEISNDFCQRNENRFLGLFASLCKCIPVHFKPYKTCHIAKRASRFYIRHKRHWKSV